MCELNNIILTVNYFSKIEYNQALEDIVIDQQTHINAQQPRASFAKDKGVELQIKLDKLNCDKKELEQLNQSKDAIIREKDQVIAEQHEEIKPLAPNWPIQSAKTIKHNPTNLTNTQKQNFS